MMNHRFWKTLLGIFAGIFVTVILAWVLLAPIVSTYLSEKLGVKVMVGRIFVLPESFSISTFRIRNPQGFHHKNAFFARRIWIDYRFSEVMERPTHIRDISLKDIKIRVDFMDDVGLKNNWTEILGALQEKTGKNRPLKIDRMTFENINIEIWGRGFNAQLKRKIHFDKLTFQNINSKEGFPTTQIIAQMFQQLGIQNYIQHILSPTHFLHELFSPFFGKKKDAQNKFERLCYSPIDKD